MKIRFENVTFYYNNKLPNTKPVLEDINLEIKSNEFIGLIGPSGSGKTTLVQNFTGLLHPSEGKVFINDIDISNNNVKLDSIRKQIGVVFQFPEAQLFEDTVYDDVAFGPRNFGLPEEKIGEQLKDTFNLIGIDLEKMKARSPFKLSEGEKRRVALAGIIAMNPEFLVLDEPTACLDAIGIHRIERLLTSLHSIGKAIILVSHNLEFVVKLCQRIIVLQGGKIRFDGLKEKLFKDEKILEVLDLGIPRIIRYSQKLFKLGYISENKIYSIEQIKLALGV